MSASLLALLVANFVAIAALPFAAFRRDGRPTAGWLATAAPFFLAVPILVASAFGVDAPGLEPLAAAHRLMLEGFAAFASASSLVLLVCAARAHRVRPALWHQHPERDAPAEIVTRGPYARIRHPFYSSFLLALGAAVVAMPNAATAALFSYALGALAGTAAREERRLAASVFGAEYLAYVARTGRFVPRLSFAR